MGADAMKRLFAAFLLLVSYQLQAETIPATSTTPTVESCWVPVGGGTGSTCLSEAQALSWCQTNVHANATFPYNASGGCNRYGFYNGPTAGTSCGGIVVASGSTCSAVYSCPAGQNWTLSGTNCTRPDCQAGEIRNSSTGICEAACGGGATWDSVVGCKCDGLQSYNTTAKSCECANLGSLKGRDIGGSGSDSPSTTCYSGCTFNVGGLSVATGGQWVAQLGTATGAKCSAGTGTTPQEVKAKEPTADTRTDAQKCLAAGQGYVTTSTGTTCTSSGNSPTPIATKTEETKTTKDQTGAVTGTQETKVECVGSQCTTTVTTKDASGAVTGTTVTAGTGSGSGTGTGSGNGSGETDCDKHPTAIGCLDAGTPGGNDAVGTSPIGLNSISPVSLGGGGSCPSPVTLPRGQTFSWQPICDFAFGIRPIVLVLAWLAAAYIVLGWGTKDNG